MNKSLIIAIALAGCNSVHTTAPSAALCEQPSYSAVREQFLKDMSQLESSSGRNTNHRMLYKGIHAGHKAVGQYGLMPLTVQDMLKRLKQDGVVIKIDGSPQQIANFVAKHPALEAIIAEKLYDHVYRRFNGNLELMSISWLNGHNGSPSAYRGILEGHERTRRFRALRR